MSLKKIAISFCFVILVGNLEAQVPYYLKTSKMTVAGTSTLHDWVSDVTKMEWTGQLLVENNVISKVSSARVSIPVASIKSTKGKMMDSKTWEAFNYEKNPNIVFQLSGAVVNPNQIQATGTLSMAGASKPIQLTVKTKMLSNGEVQLTGSYKLNMKDYKMETPTAMMGTIKVGEEITVEFDLTISANNALSNSK